MRTRVDFDLSKYDTQKEYLAEINVRRLDASEKEELDVIRKIIREGQKLNTKQQNMLHNFISR